MSQDNKKKEYICPFCGCKMIVYESIESWLECSYCHFETQIMTNSKKSLNLLCMELMRRIKYENKIKG